MIDQAIDRMIRTNEHAKISAVTDAGWQLATVICSAVFGFSAFGLTQQLSAYRALASGIDFCQSNAALLYGMHEYTAIPLMTLSATWLAVSAIRAWRLRKIRIQA